MTKFLLIAIAVLTLLLSISGYLLKQSYEEVGELKIKVEIQRAETEKAIAEINSIKEQHKLQLQLSATHLENERKDNARFTKQIRELQNTASTSKAAAIKEPERYGAVATYSDRRGMRGACRASGGSPKTCAITIPKSAKAKSRPAVQPNVQDNDGVAGQDIKGGSPL